MSNKVHWLQCEMCHRETAHIFVRLGIVSCIYCSSQKKVVNHEKTSFNESSSLAENVPQDGKQNPSF